MATIGKFVPKRIVPKTFKLTVEQAKMFRAGLHQAHPALKTDTCIMKGPAKGILSLPTEDAYRPGQYSSLKVQLNPDLELILMSKVKHEKHPKEVHIRKVESTDGSNSRVVVSTPGSENSYMFLQPQFPTIIGKGNEGLHSQMLGYLGSEYPDMGVLATQENGQIVLEALTPSGFHVTYKPIVRDEMKKQMIRQNAGVLKSVVDIFTDQEWKQHAQYEVVKHENYDYMQTKAAIRAARFSLAGQFVDFRANEFSEDDHFIGNFLQPSEGPHRFNVTVAFGPEHGLIPSSVMEIINESIAQAKKLAGIYPR